MATLDPQSATDDNDQRLQALALAEHVFNLNAAAEANAAEETAGINVAAKAVPNPQSVTYGTGQRLQALALAEHGVSLQAAAEASGMSGGARAVRRLQQKARSRGYDPAVSKILKLEYVVDAPRSGRPTVAIKAKDRKASEREAARLSAS